MAAAETDGPATTPSDLGVMEGGGFYNRHSRPQHDAIALGLPLLERAARDVPLPAPGAALWIADYGVAGGHNSMEPVRRVIDLVRQRGGSQMPLAVVHTDLPTNDFGPLFQLLSTSESYSAGMSGVFSYAASGSFYDRLFPDATVCIGWNAIAVHWLSTVPATIPDHIWSNRATGVVKEAFAQQAQQDWTRFLDNRAHELTQGGSVVVLGGASGDDGNSDAEGLMDMANAVLTEMVRQGVLDTVEYEHMAIPTYNRTLREFTAPFGDAGRSGSLRLQSASEAVLDDEFSDSLQQTGDVAAYAEAYASFFRAAFGPSLFAALADHRSDRDRRRIAETFYDKLRHEISADPARASCHWHVAVLLVSRAAGE